MLKINWEGLQMLDECSNYTPNDEEATEFDEYDFDKETDEGVLRMYRASKIFKWMKVHNV